MKNEFNALVFSTPESALLFAVTWSYARNISGVIRPALVGSPNDIRTCASR